MIEVDSAFFGIIVFCSGVAFGYFCGRHLQ